MITSKKVILISAGEPSSISTEITIKTIMSSKVHSDIMPIVITDPQIIIDYFKLNKINYEINEIKDKQRFKDFKKNKINIIPIKLLEKVVMGIPNVKNASFVKDSIIKCVKTLQNSIASALVTNPINKKIMYESGFNYTGHTEFLASLSVKKKTSCNDACRQTSKNYSINNSCSS